MINKIYYKLYQTEDNKEIVKAVIKTNCLYPICFLRLFKASTDGGNNAGRSVMSSHL